MPAWCIAIRHLSCAHPQVLTGIVRVHGHRRNGCPEKSMHDYCKGDCKDVKNNSKLHRGCSTMQTCHSYSVCMHAGVFIIISLPVRLKGWCTKAHMQELPAELSMFFLKSHLKSSSGITLEQISILTFHAPDTISVLLM